MRIAWRWVLPVLFAGSFSISAWQVHSKFLTVRAKAEPAEIFSCQVLQEREMTQEELNSYGMWLYECGSVAWTHSPAERSANLTKLPGLLVAFPASKFFLDRYGISMVPTTYGGAAIVTFLFYYFVGMFFDRKRRG